MKNLLNEAKPFLDEDFLLDNQMAKVLYHDYAKHQPIIDYHNHLPPSEIFENRIFENITKVWLYGDHYKWRAMRTLGINEKYITGEANDKEKFLKWAEAVPFTIRNPLFHWTHLELKRYFDIHEILNLSSASEIYDECNIQLNQSEYGAQGLLKKMNVEVVCTTDDPADNLAFHIAHAQKENEVKMLPAFRPDKAILIGSDAYLSYIEKLSDVSGLSINKYDDLIQVLKERMDFFAQHGCTVSDHGLNKVYGRAYDHRALSSIFAKKTSGEILTPDECAIFISGIMHDLGVMYAERGWVMQLHLGALRNTNTRMLDKLGPDTGFDSIGDYALAEDLAAFLNGLDSKDRLPKTILYNLNPRDNEVMASMIGNYNDGSLRGKVQYGSSWWFLDQKDGMEKQMNALSNMGLLSCFIGMLTDSRSFLSFPRHEYFRRILCNLIGRDVQNGELPYDEKWLGGIVADISYNNAKNYFKF